MSSWRKSAPRFFRYSRKTRAESREQAQVVPGLWYKELAIRHELVCRLPVVAPKVEPVISTVSYAGTPRRETNWLLMRYYFYQHLNGRSAEDRRGRLFGSAAEACSYAMRRTTALLGKTVRPTTNTHLSTEVSDGRRTLGGQRKIAHRKTLGRAMREN